MFGAIIKQLKIICSHSGYILQKCQIDGLGFGGNSVTHSSFSSFRKSKMKQNLKILLTAVDEIATYFDETGFSAFIFPYQITEKEMINGVSFLDIFDETHWKIALKYFLLDIEFLARYSFSK